MFAYLVLMLVALTGSTNGLSPDFDEVDDAVVKRAIIEAVAHFAVSNHPGERLEEGYHDALEKIVSVEEQLVAGKLYTLKMLVGASGCSVKSEYDRQLCKVKASSQSRLCTAKVHVQVWMKPQNAVISWDCE